MNGTDASGVHGSMETIVTAAPARPVPFEEFFAAEKRRLLGALYLLTGNRHASIAPYDTFETSDGVLVLAVGNDAQWQNLCAELKLFDLAGDARYETNAGRVEHYAPLRILLARELRAWRLDDLVVRLRAAGVPCGAVRSIDRPASG